jgi:hypothetical protein
VSFIYDADTEDFMRTKIIDIDAIERRSIKEENPQYVAFLRGQRIIKNSTFDCQTVCRIFRLDRGWR